MNLLGRSLFYFKRLDIQRASIGQSSQKLWLLEFSWSFLVQYQAFRYIMCLNRTSNSKVMAIWIAQRFRFKFWASWYIMGLNRTFESNVMFPRASLFNIEYFDILWASIGNLSQKLCMLEFSWSFLVQFWASWYIMGINRTSESKVIGVSIVPLLLF